MIGHLSMESTSTQSSNELQWLDVKRGHQDGSPSNDRWGDLPYSSAKPQT